MKLQVNREVGLECEDEASNSPETSSDSNGYSDSSSDTSSESDSCSDSDSSSDSEDDRSRSVSRNMSELTRPLESNDEKHEEEEEDDEDERPRKKRKGDKFRDFITDETEVDDDPEDDEKWEDSAEEIEVTNEMHEVGQTARDMEGRRRGTNQWDSQKEEKIEEYPKKNELKSHDHFGSGGKLMGDQIIQQSLLPAIGLRPRQLVRMKRGLYKNDIAQIDYVLEAENKVHLKLIPRIDYTILRGVFLLYVDQELPNKAKRPEAQLFDLGSARATGGDVDTDGDFYMFEGNRYSREGFLCETFGTRFIDAEGIEPTLSELETFGVSPEEVNVDFDGAPSTSIPAVAQSVKSTHTFSNGDNVIVCEGDSRNLQGKITTIDGDLIYLVPKQEGFNKILQFNAQQLKKFFQTGDHVKVLAGKYEGSTGLIIRLQSDRVVVLSDISFHEQEVLAKNLQLCVDIATGVDSLRKIKVGDLVNLDNNTVGIVTRETRESFQILAINDKIVEFRRELLIKRRIRQETVALDQLNNWLQREDVVKIVAGRYCDQYGTIKQLYRSFAFVLATNYIGIARFCVCRTRQLQLCGRSSGISGNSRYVTAVSKQGGPRGCVGHGDHGGRGGRGGHGGRGGGGHRQNREFIGMTVKIIRGPYKGYIGIIKEVLDISVCVELHTTCQTVSVRKNNIVDCGAPGSASFSNGRTPLFNGSGTPMYNRDGSKTPMYESYLGTTTPVHNVSRATGGAWDPSVANSPAAIGFPDDYENAETPDFAFTPKFPTDHSEGLTSTPKTECGSERSYSSTEWAEFEDWLRRINSGIRFA